MPEPTWPLKRWLPSGFVTLEPCGGLWLWRAVNNEGTYHTHSYRVDTPHPPPHTIAMRLAPALLDMGYPQVTRAVRKMLRQIEVTPELREAGQ